MPYPAGHRERMRKKIVESARRLFNRRGFENVSVDSIMAHAGLTRGGFYSYFDSKSDLYAEVLGCFFTGSSLEEPLERSPRGSGFAGRGPANCPGLFVAATF
jgi:TetR/AcrR family transcriptional repressor of nem operon